MDTHLIQTYPVTQDLPETPGEEALRALYPHAPGIVRVGMISAEHGESEGQDGTSRSLQGSDDLRVLRVLRAAADVVVVGGETARREHYSQIRLRDALVAARSPDQAPTPIVAVVTLTGSVPEGLNPSNSLLVTTRNATAIAQANFWGDSTILAGKSEPSPEEMIAAFAKRGLTRVLCEGGPALSRLFLDAGVVTDFCLTTSPRPGGKGARHVPPVPTTLDLAHTLQADGFTFRRWCTRPE